ncbi:hypothetical protein SAMN05421504_1011368 [Amycolatopsis xylanica]|uniref:Secreted protein n=1 Tax=Amycolatopsis xylanica TaxID=589385 RepID=A0A1H2VYJ5_9PSEU|nr:hypothetical protein [Amycolatopsis xylanica]SDW73415.1 hypothetical protein SAMN05421504_1011368 [Amycolatopsis xylanica]
MDEPGRKRGRVKLASACLLLSLIVSAQRTGREQGDTGEANGLISVAVTLAALPRMLREVVIFLELVTRSDTSPTHAAGTHSYR